MIINTYSSLPKSPLNVSSPLNTVAAVSDGDSLGFLLKIEVTSSKPGIALLPLISNKKKFKINMIYLHIFILKQLAYSATAVDAALLNVRDKS